MTYGTRFFAKSSIDYDEKYSFVVNAITFRYLVSLVIYEKIDMHLMDIVIIYFYGTLTIIFT
jgi:hypothetical protein